MKPMLDILTAAPIIPVFEVSDLNHAAPLAEALAAGGLETAELTMRTPEAADALTIVKKTVPSMMVGMGTITGSEAVERASDCGADFLVTPGATPTLMERLAAQGIPFLPGVSTASEAMIAGEFGVTELKFFPAEALGGTEVLKALRGPLPGFSFCATGGIKMQRVGDYLSLPNVASVGGSWIAPRGLIEAKNWAAITKNAQAAKEIVTSIQNAPRRGA